MEVYLSDQLAALIGALFLGIVLGLAYDLVRISRIIIGVRYSDAASVSRPCRRPLSVFSPPKKIANYLPKIKKRRRKKHRPTHLLPILRHIAVFFGDIVFFAFAAAAFCIFVHFSGGEFRFFMLFSLTVGGCLYYFTAGKLVLSLSDRIVGAIKTVTAYLTYALMRPLTMSLFLLIAFFFSIFNKFMLILRRLYDIIYCKKFSAYRMKQAERRLFFGLPQ